MILLKRVKKKVCRLFQHFSSNWIKFKDLLLHVELIKTSDHTIVDHTSIEQTLLLLLNQGNYPQSRWIIKTSQKLRT